MITLSRIRRHCCITTANGPRARRKPRAYWTMSCYDMNAPSSTGSKPWKINNATLDQRAPERDQICQYSDIYMRVMATQITGNSAVYSTASSANNQGNTKICITGPFCGESGGRRWIPLKGKVLTSSCPVTDSCQGIPGQSGVVLRIIGIQSHI